MASNTPPTEHTESPTPLAPARYDFGLSPRTEKFIGAASAFAAAVAVVGASMWAPTQGIQVAHASSLAPLVSDISTPRAFDLLGNIVIPARTTTTAGPSGVTAGVVRRVAASTARDGGSTDRSTAPTLATQRPDTGTAAPTDGASTPGDLGGADDIDVVDQLATGIVIGGEVLPGVPVAADVSDDPGLTIGPLKFGSAPEGDDSRNVLGSPSGSSTGGTPTTAPSPSVTPIATGL